MFRLQYPNYFRLGIILVVIFYACNSSDHDLGLSLDTKEAKQSFLEQLFESDQELRQGQSAMIFQSHGMDSKAYRDFINRFMVQDSFNVIQAENYLNQYGYPVETELGEIATIAPWAVIHHANDLEVRNRNFALLYSAYSKKDIDDSAMSMYLSKTYELTFGERLEMESPFNNVDRINKLILLLGLNR